LKKGYTELKRTERNYRNCVMWRILFSGISLTDEWLYYEVYDVKDSSTRVYRMRLDGSSHQKFKITEDHVPDEVENVKNQN